MILTPYVKRIWRIRHRCGRFCGFSRRPPVQIQHRRCDNRLITVKTGAADDYRITLLDVTGDGKDEIFVSGGGNALYGFTSGFAPLDGFPLAGTGTPYLLDIDGDSFPELITHGIDSKVHAYRGAVLR